MSVLGNEQLRVRRRIGSWPEFARVVRSRGCHLLRELDRFPRAVLVSGCQRSGTTMLTRVISASDGMADFREGHDDELDAALILCGANRSPNGGRHCFQTTYLNECYREYFDHTGDFRLIWVLRNPYSVVWSLAHHWGSFAFNELFDSCGSTLLEGKDRRRYETFGGWVIAKAKRACLSYNAKLSQVFAIRRAMGERVAVVDYDDLVLHKETLLPQVYEFIDHPYRPEYAEPINAGSLKKATRLGEAERELVEQMSLPVYRRARELLTIREGE